MAKSVWTKPWYRSRGIWGSLLAGFATLYGLWTVTLPCGVYEHVHEVLSSGLGLFGAYLAFVGRKTAQQPIHFLWPVRREIAD